MLIRLIKLTKEKERRHELLVSGMKQEKKKKRPLRHQKNNGIL